MTSESELGWLAGIIDGEGTIVLFLGVGKNGKLRNVSPQIVIGNTEHVMIEKCADIMQKLGVGAHISSREPKRPCGVEGSKVKSTYKTLHVISVVGYSRSQKLLQAIVPYLITGKKERGEMILRFIEQRGRKMFKDGKFRCGRFQGSNFDVDDMRLIRDIVATGRSKHLHIVEGLLRDYTQGPLPQAA